MRIKKADIILLTVIVLSALLLLFVYEYVNTSAGRTVIISVDGVEYARLDLSADSTYTIEGTNGYDILEIRDREVWMKEADCPDKICIAHRPIHSSGESIICLPNRIVVEISDEMYQKLDGVAY